MINQFLDVLQTIVLAIAYVLHRGFLIAASILLTYMLTNSTLATSITGVFVALLLWAIERD